MPRPSVGLAAVLLALLTGTCGGDEEIPCRAQVGFCQCGPEVTSENIAGCSMSTFGGVGLCCQGKQSCTCDHLVCRDTGNECTCGPAAVLDMPDMIGTHVSACPPRQDQICCFSPGDVFCHCRHSDHCLASEDVVASCNPGKAECAAGFDPVTACR